MSSEPSRSGSKVPTGFGYMDEDGVVDPDRPVELWISARMTHIFALATMIGVEGAREYMDHGVNALLMDGDSSPEAIAKAIEGAASDRDRLSRIALEARQMVEKRFSWDEVARQTQDFYEGIVDCSGMARGEEGG